MSNDIVQANTAINTVPAGEAPEMPPTQIAALDALLSGKTATDAAAAAGLPDARFTSGLPRITVSRRP